MLNKLICLEGLDGSGKSTQVKFVKKYLEDNNLKYKFFHFPMYGHNEFSNIIAKFLCGEFGGVKDVNPYFVANIYAMDRFMFLPELKEAIEKNDVVLLDRYVFSNLAYQGAKLESKEREIIKNWIYDFEFKFLKLPYPDLSIFFDVPIDIIKKRLEDNREGEDRKYLNGGKDIHEENIEFQGKVRDNYLSLIGSVNYHIVKCALRIEDPPYSKWIILSPEEIFKSYRKSLDYIIFNIPYNA